MYVIIWEYQVKADRLAEFESIYAANGAWAELFGKNAGYLGTELLRNKENPATYLTIDRWTSEEAFEHFKRDWGTEYQTLDAEYNGLTMNETLLGKFEK